MGLIISLQARGLDIINERHFSACGGRSSVGRALDCDSGCRGFKPRRSPQFSRGPYRTHRLQIIPKTWVALLNRTD